MKYMVVECHFSYAVVLDEQGRFLKVANLNYQVGQMLDYVVEMQEVVEEKTKFHWNVKWLSGFVATFACVVLMFSSVLNNQTYASVFLKINPEVRIDVNRKDIVVYVEGVNVDGQELIKNYSYQKKTLDQVMDELMDLAIEDGYLSAGDKVTITLDAKDNEWVVTHEESMNTRVNELVDETFEVTFEIHHQREAHTDYGKTDYGDTDYGPNNDGVTDYEDTDYGPDNDGVTDYDDTDDGVTDYDEEMSNDHNDKYEHHEDSSDDGHTDYDEPESSSDDGESSYDSSESDSGYDEPEDSDGNSDYDDE